MKFFLFAILGVALLGAGCTVFTNEPTEESAEDANIIVISPAEGAIVTSPITIKGEGRVFESTVAWRILDQNGEVALEGNIMTNAPKAGEFGNFEERIFLPALTNESFTLEVFTYSAKDGSQQDIVARNLRVDSIAKTSVEVYFVDEGAAEYGDCSAVDFEKRTMAYTTNVAELALEELLKGPTSAWATTLIPNFTIIQSISVKDGIATVVFESPDTNEWSGGSCKVTAMRAQLEKTLTQFSTVESIEISVNGESESILQP